jgi:hypothetical protein
VSIALVLGVLIGYGVGFESARSRLKADVVDALGLGFRLYAEDYTDLDPDGDTVKEKLQDTFDRHDVPIKVE